MAIRHHTNEKGQTMTTVNFGSTDMQLINEALSRVRMPSPQEGSEARRSARRIAMLAHRRQARELGNLAR